MSRRALCLAVLLIQGLTLLPSGPALQNIAKGASTAESVTIPLLATPQTLNPISASTQWEKQAIEPIYEPLLSLLPDGRWIPWIGSEVVASENLTRWQVSLNSTYSSRMYWHDHSFENPKPVRMEDVVYTYQFIIRHRFAKWSLFWTLVQSAEIVNDTTLQLTLFEPYSALPNLLTQIPILPEHVWSSIEARTRDDDPSVWTRRLEDYNPEPEELAGCGPFAFVEYVVGSYVKLAAFRYPDKFLGRFQMNASYWAEGVVLDDACCQVPVGPYIDEIVMPVMGNPDELLSAIDRGIIDATSWVPSPVALRKLLKNPNVRLYLPDEPTILYLAFNLWDYPFNGTTAEEIAQTKAFRKAIAYALDRHQIVSQYLQGLGRPGNAGVIPWVLTGWVHPNAANPREEGEDWRGIDTISGGLDYEHNLSKSSELLDGIGWTDRDGDGFREDGNGFPLSLRVTVPTPTMHDSAPYNVAFHLWNQLRRLSGGAIDVQIEPLPIAQMLSQRIYPRTYNLFIASWTLDWDPDWLYYLFHSSQAGVGASPNYSNFNMSYFDELAEAQRKSSNTESRKAILWEVQEVLADELPYIELLTKISPYAHRVEKYAGWVEMPGHGAVNRWSYLFLRSSVSLPYVTLLRIPSFILQGTDIEVAVRVTQEYGEPITNATVELLIPQAAAYGATPPVLLLNLTDSNDYRAVISSEGWPLETYSARLTILAPPSYGVTILPFDFAITGSSPGPVPTFTGMSSLAAVVLVALLLGQIRLCRRVQQKASKNLGAK